MRVILEKQGPLILGSRFFGQVIKPERVKVG